MARRDREEDVAYSLARIEEAKRRDAARNDRWTDIEAIRYRQHPVPVPKRFLQQGLGVVRTSHVNRDIRTVVAITTETFPRIECPPVNESQREQERSSLVEKVMNAALRKLDSANGPQRPYKRAADTAATYGLGVHKLLYLPDAWDPSELARRVMADATEEDAEYLTRVERYKQGAPLPFLWQALDPRTFHGYYEAGKLVEVLEITRRGRLEVAERYRRYGVRYDRKEGRLTSSRWGRPEAEEALGADDSSAETLEFTEHWLLVPVGERKSKGTQQRVPGQRWTAVVRYLADGIVLHEQDMGYDRLPYFPFFGIATASASPQFEAQGVAEDIIGYAPALDFLLTLRQNWGYIAGYAMMLYRRQMPAGGVSGTPGVVPDVEAAIKALEVSPVAPIEFEPGVAKELLAGEDLSWMQPPPVGADLAQMPQILLELMREASIVPDVLRGKIEPNTPAYSSAQGLAAATRNIDPITDNHSLALTQLVQFLLWLIEHKHADAIYVDSPTQAEGKRVIGKKTRLRPEDIAGNYGVSVEITTLSQDRMIQLGQFLAQMQAQGAISMKELRQRGLQYQAPEEMDLEVLFERYVNSPKFEEEVWAGFQMLAKRAGVVLPSALPAAPPPGQPQPGMEGLMPPPGGAPMGPEAIMGPQASAVQPIAGAPAVQSPTPGLGLPLVSPVLGSGPVVG